MQELKNFQFENVKFMHGKFENATGLIALGTYLQVGTLHYLTLKIDSIILNETSCQSIIIILSCSSRMWFSLGMN